jgi:hypothetical protein
MHNGRRPTGLNQFHRKQSLVETNMRNLLMILVAVTGIAGAVISTTGDSFACDPGETNWRGECDWSGE